VEAGFLNIPQHPEYLIHMSQTISQATLVQCENEPIHIPGAIQPFGILVSIDIPSLKITNASVNCAEVFGVNAVSLVNRSLAEHLSATALASLRAYISADDLVEAAPLVIPILDLATQCEREWELTAHLRHGVLILECEALAPQEALSTSLQRSIRSAVHVVFAASSLLDLCQRTAEQVRMITGFDRVMIYRFTEDWHGDVVAEAKSEQSHSYLHHHFPASDIPAQARRIFLENWLRMIPDVGYAPVPIYPDRNPATGGALDLGLSALRSVSPLHVEYLRNMGVGATLTLPLIDGGKLWGLIACHHPTPNKLGSDRRLGAKMIAQIVSSQLVLKESMEDQRYRGELKRIHAKLIARTEEEDDLVPGLVKRSQDVLDLAGAGSAAIYYNGSWTTIGQTPDVGQLELLVEWLSAEHANEQVYATNQLGNFFPQARQYKDIASGLLAMSILKADQNYVLWFRPEVITTVVWAGAPDKRVQVEDGVARLHPRFSFDSWKQVVDGVATPWKRAEVEAVSDFRVSVLAYGLRRAFRQEQAARELAERASLEKESLVHMVSHDIRNPLSVLKMTLQVMQMDQALTPAMLAQLVARGLRATDSIERLVTSVLDFAKKEHAALAPGLQLENVNALIREAIDLALPLARKAEVGVSAAVEPGKLMIACKRTRVEQVLGNLISNALKFTPAGGRITVAARHSDGEVVVSVADTGIGIAPALLPRIFDRFTQGRVGSEKGAGLGLSIVKGIVEQEGGRLWVDSAVGVGSTFYFTLPLRQE